MVGGHLSEKRGNEILLQESYRSAWNEFINRGVLDQESLQSHIARSWLRCRAIDPTIDPMNNRQTLSERQLRKRCADNRDLITITEPVLQDICKLIRNHFVLLSDHEGYNLIAASNIDYPLPLGAKCREEDIGTNAIGAALVEDQFVLVNGYEHYTSYLHTTSCAAMPVHDPAGRVLGVINITNPYGELQPGMDGVLRICVRMIEQQLAWKTHQVRRVHPNSLSSALMEAMEQFALVVDQNGTIVDLNNKCADILGCSGKDRLIGLPFKDISRGPQDITIIGNGHVAYGPGTEVELRTKKAGVQCRVVRNSPLNTDDGATTLLLLEPAAMSLKAPVRPSQPVYSFGNIIGNTEGWAANVARAKKAARVYSSVLIQGESGTGKEMIAQAIHAESGRKGFFVPINCGAIPKGLIESELFGYEEGAFTGARRSGKQGKIQMAHGGTLFLDEIGEMPLEMQVHLLRFLQDRMYTRVGGTELTSVDVRVIAATNCDLSKAVADGRFREDLYYRLNVISIDLPPLRERKADIPRLSTHFVNLICRQMQQPVPEIAPSAMDVLCAHDWPGNVRELSNVIENAVVFTEGDVLLPAALPPGLNRPTSGKPTSVRKLKTYEKELIEETLNRHNGNVSKAARELGISRNTLYNKMKHR